MYRPTLSSKSLEHEYGMTLSSEARASIDDAFTGTLPDNNPAEILTILSEVYNFDIKPPP